MIPADWADAQCPDMKFAAAQSKDGTLQGFYRLPADLCYKLPDVSPSIIITTFITSCIP